jgi:hypothetical protein
VASSGKQGGQQSEHKAEARGGARQVRRCGSKEGGMTEVETREAARMGRQSDQG